MMSALNLGPCVVLASALALLVACSGGGGSGPGATSPETSSGTFNPAATNQAKCSACHAPFDPGGHTREDLERILGVHQKEKRVTLSQDDWQKMIDYLAKK